MDEAVAAERQKSTAQMLQVESERDKFRALWLQAQDKLKERETELHLAELALKWASESVKNKQN